MRTTQEQKILNHLKLVGTLSGVEAADLYRVRDLPKRISVLRSRGTEIASELRTDFNGQRYMRYALTQEALDLRR
jgi:hypothetical protein